ncbi:MAG: transcriptional regulator [Acidobacteria bacterium]|nr:MAG: transcriptional regulator [Acidobacteriota bacterium]
MKVKPIKTEKDHQEALKTIERLWGSPEDTPKGDLLDVLIALVEAYERAHHPIDPPDPLDAIKFRLEQQGADYASLIGVIGHRTRVYEVMRGDRPLSLDMIRRLHTHLRIPADVLIRPSRRHRVKRLGKRRVTKRARL